MTDDDSRLLELLGRALTPAAVEPSAQRISALRSLVGTPAPPASAPQPAQVTVLRPTRRWQTALMGVAAGLVLFVAGGAVATSPPTWLRQGAYDVGLPVDSPQLVQARAALHDLGVALAAGDRAGIRSADTEMVGLVRSLSADEKNEIEPVAHEVHERAVAALQSA